MRADSEIYIRFRNAQIVKKQSGHLFIVVLAGMNQGRFDLRMFFELRHERRDFHEIRARSDNVRYFKRHSSLLVLC